MSSDDSLIQIRKGRGLSQTQTTLPEPKQFVFDLDETIGSFSDLYILFQCIDHFQSEYNIVLYDDVSILVSQMLQLYPEFFRHGIEIVMEYLHNKKAAGACSGVYIYTNNSCIPDTWPYFITNFIETNWNLPGLFDSVIRAFKINGNLIDQRRNTSEKTHSELLRCLILPRNTEFCYLDNEHYPKMEHRYVYYLQPRPYHHYLNNTIILERFIKSELGHHMAHLLKADLYHILPGWYTNRGYSLNVYRPIDIDIDLHISKRILKYMCKFFSMTRKHPYTRHRRTSSMNTTHKIRSVGRF